MMLTLTELENDPFKAADSQFLLKEGQPESKYNF